MGLLVYKQTGPGEYAPFSIDGDFSNPIATTHDGRNGTTEELKFYVGREEGNEHSFSDIRLEVQSSGTDDVGSGSSPGASGWGVKIMLDPGHDPTEAEWANTDYGSTITFEDITGDEKLPFWYRIESPRGQDVQNKTNIFFLLMFVESS